MDASARRDRRGAGRHAAATGVGTLLSVSGAASATAAAWPRDELEVVRSCPACGERDRKGVYQGLPDRLFPTPGSWSFWRCGACRSLYLDPRPSPASIGRAYERYMTHTRPASPPARAGLAGAVRKRILNGHLNSRYGYRLEPATRSGASVVGLVPRMTAQIDRWVRHLRPNGERPCVLDVGCGNGEFMLRMTGLGWEAHGLDFDARALKEARTAGLSVREGSLADLDPGERRYDAVTLGHVIEHLHEPVAELRRARQLLRPGGMVWLATPNVEALGHRLFRDSWLALDPPRHLVLFNAASLTAVLERAGFAPVRRLTPGPGARWVFPASHAIACRLDPLGADPVGAAPPLPPGLRLRALTAELVAWRDPRAAEELILVGWRPGD